MEIKVNGNPCLTTYRNTTCFSTPNNLSPLKKDTVSFQSVKKNTI